MSNSECVWFRNKSTGYVDGVEKGSAAHRRLLTEAVDDKDGNPQMVWEQVSAPETSTTKYESGLQAEVQVPGAGDLVRPAAPVRPAEAPDEFARAQSRGEAPGGSPQGPPPGQPGSTEVANPAGQVIADPTETHGRRPADATKDAPKDGGSKDGAKDGAK